MVECDSLAPHSIKVQQDAKRKISALKATCHQSIAVEKQNEELRKAVEKQRETLRALSACVSEASE